MEFKLHEPVLLHEVVNMLNCGPGKSYVDCTLGSGGHAEAILERLGGNGKLIGIDCDGSAIAAASDRLQRFGAEFVPIHDNFVNIGDVLKRLNVEFVDGILFDLGVSSNQLDEPSRGFSFRNDGPLDMRMDSSLSMSACELVNQLPERDLSELLWNYGEERKARRIARRIVESRKRKAIRTTKELADIVVKASPSRGRIHPATRTFQALRIAVNRELEVLRDVLEKAACLLSPGGRICIISYHSLEDRIVKREFLRLSAAIPEGTGEKVRFRIVVKKPVVPSREEMFSNRRCRSAKMRVAERLK
jgi:16S rRNA (cytosine1402-N4)-methyltransferase